MCRALLLYKTLLLESFFYFVVLHHIMNEEEQGFGSARQCASVVCKFGRAGYIYSSARSLIEMKTIRVELNDWYD